MGSVKILKILKNFKNKFITLTRELNRYGESQCSDRKDCFSAQLHTRTEWIFSHAICVRSCTIIRSLSLHIKFFPENICINQQLHACFEYELEVNLIPVVIYFYNNCTVQKCRVWSPHFPVSAVHCKRQGRGITWALILTVNRGHQRTLAKTSSWLPLTLVLTPLNFRKLEPLHASTFFQNHRRDFLPLLCTNAGVWPEHESFDDEGMDPIPEKWKGECETGQSFPEFYCNRKLIGARYFSEGYEAIWGQINTSDPTVSLSPRDTEGHGTHTITTLGGSRTTNVSFQGTGLAVGTARGGASNARVAAYKVCWPGSCQTADILAAFDMAIHDGVDVISISLGASAIDYFYDSIAIGAFHATDKGILVVAAGGNSGPSKATVSNGAPWILTAAASSIDREFLSDIHLGNNVTYSVRLWTSINPSMRFCSFLRESFRFLMMTWFGAVGRVQAWTLKKLILTCIHSSTRETYQHKTSHPQMPGTTLWCKPWHSVMQSVEGISRDI